MTVTIGTQPVALEDLEPFPGNARRGNVELILDSLRANGQYKPLTVRRQGEALTILAGNHTYLALLRHEEDDRTGCTDWELSNDRPCQLCINVDRDDPTALAHLIECDDATAIRINLVDNKAADEGDYDQAALDAILASLEGDLVGSGYALSDAELFASEAVTGVEPGTPSADASEHTPDPGDTYTAADTPDVPEAPAERVTQRGDIWLLGPHRIMCGDCRDDADVDRLLDGATVNLAFTSPPYASQRDYDEESGFKPVPPDDYVEWFAPVAAVVQRVLSDDGSWFVNIKASADGLDTYLYVHDLVIAHAREWGWHYATELCWRRIGVPKSVTLRFKNQFEPVYQFTKGRWKMRPESVRHPSDSVPVAGGPGSGETSWRAKQGGDVDAGSLSFGPRSQVTRDLISGRQGQGGSYGPTGGVHGANPGMAYPGNMLPTFSGDHTATGHTAAFPVGLPQFFVRAYADAGDTVYDPFMGSGSTLLAADREDRVAYGMEISPKYVDVICKRYQEVTGVKPVLESTSVAHDFLTDAS